MGVRKVRRAWDRRGTAHSQAIHSRCGPRKNAQCSETSDAESGNESDPLATLNDGSHARSCCERQGRESKRRSTTGVRRREWKEAPSKRIWVRELKTASKAETR